MVKVGPSRLRHPAVLFRISRLMSFTTRLPAQSKSWAIDRVLFPHCDVPISKTLPIFGFSVLAGHGSAYRKDQSPGGALRVCAAQVAGQHGAIGQILRDADCFSPHTAPVCGS